MGRRGRKRQLDVESDYWKLLQSGVGTVAACKLLGVARKIGYRWRAENGGLPPGRLAESARSGRYLSLLGGLGAVEGEGQTLEGSCRRWWGGDRVITRWSTPPAAGVGRTELVTAAALARTIFSVPPVQV